MENEILKTIAKCSHYSYDSIRLNYEYLGKSFDRLLLCMELSDTNGISLTEASRNIHDAIKPSPIVSLKKENIFIRTFKKIKYWYRYN